MSRKKDKSSQKLVSPCISVCQINSDDGFCIGCYRTRSEISLWPTMNRDDQLSLLKILRERRISLRSALRPLSSRPKIHEFVFSE